MIVMYMRELPDFSIALLLCRKMSLFVENTHQNVSAVLGSELTIVCRVSRPLGKTGPFRSV